MKIKKDYYLWVMKQILDLYTDYLLSSMGKTTATGLSQLLGGDFSHDQISRLQKPLGMNFIILNML
jgi:hypothetical protein